MEKELAQIQLSAGQLCSAKDALLGQFDLSLQPSPGLITSESTDSPKAVKSDELGEKQGPRKAVQEEETTLRALEEENQRSAHSLPPLN